MMHMEVEDRKPQATPGKHPANFGRAALLASGLLAVAGLAVYYSSGQPAREAAAAAAATAAAEGEGGDDVAGRPGRKPPGSDKDVHGCLASAGYQYCPRNNTCGRRWELDCPQGYENELHCSPSQEAYPRSWGSTPLRQTRDLMELPADGGMGSSTLGDWMQIHLNGDVGSEDKRFKATYYSQNGQAFPQVWNSPPKFETDDYVPLPEPFGHGSSTMKMWIQRHLRADAANKEQTVKHNLSPNGHKYPALWEAPPKRQTKDLRELPCNFGRGSSTLRDWIRKHIDDDAACGTNYEMPGEKCTIGMPPDVVAPP